VAGSIFLKESAVVVLQNDNGASTANGVGVAIGTNLDVRSAGNLAQNFWLNFELKTAVFGVAPAAGTTVDLYLVPALDGTNFSDVTSNIPQSSYYVGSFLMLNQTAAFRSNVLGVPAQPLLYKAYIVNNSGQTLAVNWGIRCVPVQEQYT
jgi:hypothetical protein